MDGGRVVGNLLALGVSCFFAAQVTVLRKFHATVDMLPQVMIAGVISIVVAAPLALPFTATRADLGVLAVMGCIQLGTGCLLATAASRHLTATELGLLALLEPILGPIWVWALMGEHPGATTLVGARDRARRGDRQRGRRRAAHARRRCRARGVPPLA